MFDSLRSNNDLDLDTDSPLSLDSLSACEQHIEATELVRCAVLREMDDRTKHRNRNSQLAVGRLPTELLVDIILLSATSSSNQDAIDMDQLHLLGGVCFRWWHVILSTPQLWTDVRASTGATVEHQIERSGSRSLCITFDSSPLGLHPTEFMEMVTADRHRWRSLRVIATEEEWEVIAPYLTERMTLLESAHLVVKNNKGRNIPEFRFGGGPNLRSVYLEGVELATPKMRDDAFESVTRLELDGTWVTEPGSLPRLLAQFQNLIELHLTSLFSEDWTTWQAASDHILVTLPYLQVLELTEGFHWVWAPLLQGMYAKNLRRLTVGDAEHESGFSLLAHPPIIPDRPTLLQSVLSNVDFKSLTIFIDENSFTLSGTTQPDGAGILPAGSESGLEIDVRDCEEPRAAEMLHRIPLPNVPIHFKMGGWNDPSILLHFPTTASITSFGNLDYGQEYIVFLFNAAEETGVFPCPLLSEIHFERIPALSGQSQHEALEANHSLIENIRLLLKVRREIGGASLASYHGCGLKVTCGTRRKGKYVFDEATRRFILQNISR